VRAELAAERAAKERMVAKQALADGQAALTLTGPAVDVATISDGRRRLRRPPRGG
jgi:hypothetical protein